LVKEVVFSSSLGIFVDELQESDESFIGALVRDIKAEDLQQALHILLGAVGSCFLAAFSSSLLGKHSKIMRVRFYKEEG